MERIVHELGHDFWTTMKLAAERAADDGPRNGSHQLARMLSELNKTHDGKIETWRPHARSDCSTGWSDP